LNHPLTGNLRDLSDDDLSKKISELNKRLVFGYQTGNTDFVTQANALLNDYMAEERRRTQELVNSLKENNDTDWDDLIDIKK
jgi:hypothetical protein